MNIKQFSSIFDFLETVYTEDREMNKAIKGFIDIVAPWSYAPIPEWKISKVFEAFKIVYPEITELLEYYFYESKNMKWGWTIESNWKKYNYSKKEEIIQSMVDFWYLNE